MVAMHDILEGQGKPINFWGMSYGTVIGAYFVNSQSKQQSTPHHGLLLIIAFIVFPDRVGHVIIDGVVDPVLWANRPAHEVGC
jgi:hypothetical protein